MAKCFTTWTVLKHDPIEKHSENLWSVSGYMPRGNQRRMTLARRADGGLVIHNPVALGEAEMKELEAFGKPAFLIVPNGKKPPRDCRSVRAVNRRLFAVLDRAIARLSPPCRGPRRSHA